MFARVTHWQCRPDQLDAMEARIDTIRAQVKSLSGVTSIQIAWRADGAGVTMAIYESEATANAATPQVQQIWGSLADLLTAAPSVETYDQVTDMLS